MSARMHFQTLTFAVALSLGSAVATPAFSQAPGQQFRQTNQGQVGQGQQAVQGQAVQGQVQGNQPAGGRQPGQLPDAIDPRQPFPPLSQAAQQRLDQLLAKWEQQSKATKLLACDFTRWQFDPQRAPAGIHATWSRGVIRYAAPDKGEFRVDELQVYKGMNGDKATFGPDSTQQGEYWVCNGSELMEFDRDKRICRVQVLPEDMRGQKLYQSPLPFVFNLDAKELKERYWVREVAAPANKKNIFLLEAWPKMQEDRAQYLFTQIAIDAESFLPQALILYDPNFDPTNSPIFSHYEFSNVKRNGIINNFQQFMDSFIDVKPPKDWQILRETFGAPVQAQAPDARLPQQR